jgi:PKD repeat protein
MKIFTRFTALLLSGMVLSSSAQKTPSNLISQENRAATPTLTVLPVVFHGETEALRDYVADPNAPDPITKTKKVGYHPKAGWPVNEYDYTDALPLGMDPVHQKDYAPLVSNKSLGVNLDGMPGVTSPADPSLDVGPNHVIQMINGTGGSTFKIWDKSGNVIQNSTTFDNFMNSASLNGNPGWGGAGDPIVIYDQRADRWLLTEFSSSGNNLYVAVSTAADPTGSYYTYTINMPSFPDYPKYSVWENEYVITANLGSSDIVALPRADMLAGVSTNAQKFTQANFGTIGFQASTPVNLDGTTVPPVGTPSMVMRMTDDAWNGASADALEIWELDIDWTTPSNSSFTLTSTLGVSSFDTGLCGYTSFSCIPQPGTNTILDPLRELLMNRIHYRNFGTHESIVCCHSIDLDGNDWAGVRWYELRRSGGTSGTWTVYQEGTYSPDSDHRWMPTIGLSATGNIGLAYNVSSSTTFPSLRYTGRKECDPLGSMTESETVIVAGTQSNGSNRWGDYNALGLDPTDGETFWMTGMYGNSKTRVAAFDIGSCSPNVQFGNSTYDVSEADANTANGCLDYYTLNIPISIGVDPSQASDVNVSVTGGTATQALDYDIFNTSFTFSGSTLSGSVEIRVYNDNYIEGDETITLDYALNPNGGNAGNGVINQTAIVTINDDDLAPGSMTSSSVIFTEDFESGFSGFTTVNASGDTPFQIGDAAAATSGAYVVPTSNATQFAWINDDDCDCDQNDVDLTFPSIDLTGYTGATVSFDAYYQGLEWQANVEIAELRVSVNGGGFTLISELDQSGGWNTNTFDVSPYIGNNNVVFAINYSDAGGWLYGCTIDNVVIEGINPLSIQTAINTGAQTDANLGPNATVHFYDAATENIMLTIANNSSFDYGCVAVEVDRDGSSPTTVAFASSNAADYIHSKSYKVTPTNANPSGTYDITVYYEEAEVAAWEAATSNSRTNLEIIKVAGNNAIGDVSPANYGTFTIENVPATLANYNSDLTFTASFSTGFSGFGLGEYATDVPQTPVANFTNGPSTVCEGTTVSFSDLSSGVPTSWAWDFGDGNTSTAQNPSNTYSTAATYSITLISTNGFGNDTYTSTITVVAPTSSSQTLSICDGESVTVGTSTYTTIGTFTDVLTNNAGCDSTVTTNINVNTLPTINAGTDETFCIYGPLVALSGTPAGGTYSGSGVSGSNFDPTTGIGSYAVTYSYTDGNSCMNTDIINFTVDNCTGINEEILPGVLLFPNPNNGEFTLTGVEVGNTYEVFSAEGKLMLTNTVTSPTESVKLTKIAAGSYFMTTLNKDGEKGSIQFFVESK